MDSSESISFSMDTTTDSVDVSGHFTPKETNATKQQQQQPQQQQQQLPREQLLQHHKQRQQLRQKQQYNHQQDKQQFQRRLTMFESDTHRHDYEHQTTLLNATVPNHLEYQNEEANLSRLPPDKEFIIVDETPPPSTSSTTTITSQNDNSPSQNQPHQLNHFSHPEPSSAASTSSLGTFISCCSETLQDVDEPPTTPSNLTTKHASDELSPSFTSVPSEGGSTLGMKRKHFLRRRLTVDMFEEVRRRSRRQILLKIKLEKRRREVQQTQRLNNRLKEAGSSTSSQSTTPDLSDNQHQKQATTDGQQSDNQPSGSGLNGAGGGDNNNGLNGVSDLNGDKEVLAQVVGDNGDTDDEDDDDDSYSDLSDISDSELEGDSYIFLQPIGVKLRRSLLRASGVCRIDPVEKKDCKKIRDSREKSGCRCVGQCMPQYCECIRLGVKCHVDRVSFPCGCVSEGCKNPEGRTEFDMRRVRKHFEEKIFEAHQNSDSQSNDEELLTTTPSSSSTSEESC